MPSELTVKDHMTLRFQERRWKYPGARNEAIWETFHETPTRHAQRLNALIDRAEAEAAYPTLVRRLRRVREARMAGRRAG